MVLWKSVEGLFIPVSSCNTASTFRVTSRIIVRMSSNGVRASRKALFSVALPLVSFVLGILVEAFLRQESVTGWMLWIDNIAAALLLGLVVFLYERRRERELVRKLQIIELMNHHVRNALQPIIYSPYLKEQAEQVKTIQEGTRRIEWALREVLPGENALPAPKSRPAA